MKIKASFDDASAEDMKVARLLRKYKIADAIFYFPGYPHFANERSGRTSLTEDQMQDIAKHFEIGSHTMTHPMLTRIDLKRAEVEIHNSRMFLADKFKQDINSFCYPRGYANPDIQKLVADAGYSNARSTLVGYIHESENPYFEQTAVHVGCNRKEYGGKTWLEYALYMLKQAKNTSKSVFHFFGHGWEIEKNNGWADFETLLKEVSNARQATA